MKCPSRTRTMLSGTTETGFGVENVLVISQRNVQLVYRTVHLAVGNKEKLHYNC